MNVDAARQAAKGLRGSVREWLRSKPDYIRGDREVVLSLVEKDGFALEHASLALRADREVVLTAVRKGAFSFQYAAQSLRDSRAFVLAAVQCNGYALACVPDKFRADREIVLTAVREEASALEYAAEPLFSDPEIAAVAARWSDVALEHVDEELWSDARFVFTVAEKNEAGLARADMALRCNRAFVLSLIERNPAVFPYATPDLLEDFEFMLDAVTQNPVALGHVPALFASDTGFVLNAATRNAMVLKYLPQALQEDRAFLLAAVQLDPSVIEHAPQSLLSQRDFLLDAVQRRASVLELVGAELLGDQGFLLAAIQRNAAVVLQPAQKFGDDRRFLLMAVQTNKLVMEHIDAAWWADLEFVLGVAEIDWHAAARASMELLTRRDFALRLVQLQGCAVRFLASELRADWEIAEAAVRADATALGDVSQELQADSEFVLLAVQKTGDAFQYAAEELRAEPDVVLRMVRVDGKALMHASRTLLADRNFVLQATEAHGYAMQYVDGSLFEDRSFVWEAIQRNACVLNYLPASLRMNRSFVLVALRTDPAAFRFLPPSLQYDPEIAGVAQVAGVEEWKEGTFIAEQLERLEKLSAQNLQEECAALGMPSRACIEFIGLEELRQRLKAWARWRILPIQGLSAEAAAQGIVNPDAPGAIRLREGATVRVNTDFFSVSNEKLKQGQRGSVMWVDRNGDAIIAFENWAFMRSGVEHRKDWIYKKDLPKVDVEVDEAQRHNLLAQMLVNLFADVYEERAGVPVRQLGSFDAANAVLTRWEQLAEMAVSELEVEFSSIFGIGPRGGTERLMLEVQLREAAVWAQLPFAALQEACKKLSVSSCSMAPNEEAQRQELRERLLQTVCGHLYAAEGINVKSLGSLMKAGHLLTQFRHLDQLNAATLKAEYMRLSPPSAAELGDFEMRERLKAVARWKALPLAMLREECWNMGLRTAYFRSSEEAETNRDDLLKELVSFIWGPNPRNGQARVRTPRDTMRSKEGLMSARGARQSRVPLAILHQFGVLELPPDSTAVDVKKAYRRLALKYHPDKCTGYSGDIMTEDLTSRFLAVREAHEVLLGYLKEQGQ